MPQNQPNPKDAVSKMDGAASSMAGIFGAGVLDLEARFALLSSVPDAWFACIVNIKKQIDNTKTAPHGNTYVLSILFPLLFIIKILSFRFTQSLKNALN